MTQQADYLQALQGELEQTIDSISGVASSQVNIALPANQDFALNNTTPTGASVHGHHAARARRSRAARSRPSSTWCGSSVPDLDADSVTVADSSGDLLAGPGVWPRAAGSEHARPTPSTRASRPRCEAYLASVVGQGNADVQVNATLDYRQGVDHDATASSPDANGRPAELLHPDSRTNTQSYTGAGTPPGGAAGTVAIDR